MRSRPTPPSFRTGLARMLAIGACSIILTSSAIGQSRPNPVTPTFRSGVRVIEVDAVVRDMNGDFVTDLTRTDFDVLEDGQSQDIQAFSMVNLPIDVAGRPLDAPRATADGTSDDPIANIGRVYVMILDSGEVERVKGVARQFIQSYLGTADLLAVVHTRNQAAAQGLTNDKEALLAAVDRFAGGVGSINALRAIKEVAVNLNSVSGRRKAILFVGSGINLWGASADPLLMDQQRQNWREYDDAVRTAARNNVRIYPIDPGGYLSPFEGINFAGERNPFGPPIPPDREVPASPVRRPWEDFVGRTGGDSNSALPIRRGTPNPEAQSSLRLMAEDTGGIAIVNTNNYGGNFARVVRDNSAYYLLAYYSPADRDGQFHRITVRVRSRPDLSVRGSRAGYSASAPDAKGRSVKLPAALSAVSRDALRSSRPISGLPVELFAAVFQADAFDGSIMIGSHLHGAELKLAPRERIELSYVAIDRWGTLRAAERRAFTLTLDEQTRARVAQTGLRLFGRLRLPRGQYEIRVAAHQPGGSTGSALIEVEVPDFSDLPLSVSDLVVATQIGSALVTLEEDAILRRALPAQPTPNRRFNPADTITVFCEVYDSHWILSQEIGVTTTIADSAGKIAFRREEILKSANRGRFYYRGRVPLGAFARGAYTFTVEANTRVGVPASASQQMHFDVAEN